MKAIRVHQFGGPEVLQLDEVPAPLAGPGQILVRVHAAGVNPVDTYIRSGAYAAKPIPPYTPGKDAAGLVIIGTGGTAEGLRLVQEQGAHHALDHRAPGYLKQIKELTDGRGVDVIVEMASHINLGKDLTLLAKGGRVAVVGSRGPVEINPRDAMGSDATILGVMVNNASEREMAGIHAALGAGLENGALRPVIRKELPLAEAAQAHKAVMEPGAYGKIVLVP